jgi:O-antigen/teichoic acid export membrane protein
MSAMPRSAIVWNLGAFAFIAIGGAAIHVLLGRFYGAEVLGAFNQALTVYIVCSQLSVLGVHYHVLREVSIATSIEAEGERRRAIARITVAGLLAIATLSLPIAAGGVIAQTWVAQLFASPGTGAAWFWLALTLPFFSANKILFAAINGLERLRTLAVLNASRYVVLALALGVFVSSGLNPFYLTSIFLVSELLLFLIGLAVLADMLSAWRLDDRWRSLIARNLSFGARSFMSGAFAELNTRVDILVIGMFMSDRAAGIYSIAALIYEGISQIGVALRNIVNPRIARGIEEGDHDGLRRYLLKLGLLTSGLVAVASIIAVAGFPFFVDIVLGDSSFDLGFTALVILLSGLTLTAGFLLLDFLPVLAGRPVMQSAFKGGAVAVNVALNLALVPLMGIEGAALGTCLALLISAVLLIGISHRYLGLKIRPERPMRRSLFC